MAKYKRKGCGPRGLGSALKMIVEPEQGRVYKNDKLDKSGNELFYNEEFEDKNKFHRFHTFDEVNLDDPVNEGKTWDHSIEGTVRSSLVTTKKGPGSFAVPTESQHEKNVRANTRLTERTKVPYVRGDRTYRNKPNKQKTPTVEKPAQSTKTTTKKTKPSGKVAYGGTKTWAEGSKAAKASTGKSLNQLVAARKGLTKGSAEYNTIQNQINAALGSKKRHGTPAKKKGCSKKRR